MKKTLKKLFVVLLALGFVASFASCKKDAEPETNSGRSDTQQTQPNNGDDNNNGGEQGDNGGQSGDNGGSADAASGYFSYEVTLPDGSAWLFGADGKLTGKKNTAGETVAVEDGDQELADLCFVTFKLGAAGLFTSFKAGGTETVVDDPDLASMYTYTVEDGTLTITALGTTVITATASGEEYAGAYAGNQYKFKKA